MLSLFFNKSSKFDSEPVLVLGECRQPLSKVLQITELFQLIIRHLNQQELALISRVCKKWYEIVTPLVYRHVCFHRDSKRVVQFIKTIQPNLQDSLLDWYVTTAKKMWLNRSLRIDSVDSEFPCKKQSCIELKTISEQMKPKALLIPHSLGNSHRFHDTKYCYDPTYKFVNDVPICLLVQKKQPKTHWNVAQAQMYHSFGPFLKSIVITDMDMPERYFISLFEQLTNLNSVKLQNIDGITDNVLYALAKASKSNLCKLTLVGTSISDMGLHYISRNCPNLQYLECNSNSVTETGIRDILIMCPFLHTLDINQLDLPSVSMNKNVVAFIITFGIALKSLSIAGCCIKEHDILTLILSKPGIEHWSFGFSQVGTKKLSEIKKVLNQWFQSPCVKHAILERQLLFVLGDGRKVSLLSRDRINILFHQR
jgi:hypothetical protein